MQANRKRFEPGCDHPDRDQPFPLIAEQAQAFQSAGNPMISIDGKKKELIGNDKNNGKEYHPAKPPVDVNGHDFPDPKVPKAIPYGVDDPVRNTGWVNVGTDHDTGTFAVESIRQWWLNRGQEAYPNATELLITADGGGSNGSRLRLFKRELQKFADETPLAITVSHYPPGTSKFNKIEHRLFSAISSNWRGRPWINDELVVNLIRHTTTKTGLRVQAALDMGPYATRMVVKGQEMASPNIERPEGQNQPWNYTIQPQRQDFGAKNRRLIFGGSLLKRVYRWYTSNFQRSPQYAALKDLFERSFLSYPW